jgi:hypothetical protein
MDISLHKLHNHVVAILDGFIEDAEFVELEYTISSLHSSHSNARNEVKFQIIYATIFSFISK